MYVVYRYALIFRNSCEKSGEKWFAYYTNSNLVKWGLLDHLLEHVVDPCKKSRRDSQSVAKKAAQNQIKRVVLLRSRG